MVKLFGRTQHPNHHTRLYSAFTTGMIIVSCTIEVVSQRCPPSLFKCFTDVNVSHRQRIVCHHDCHCNMGRPPRHKTTSLSLSQHRALFWHNWVWWCCSGVLLWWDRAYRLEWGPLGFLMFKKPNVWDFSRHKTNAFRFSAQTLCICIDNETVWLTLTKIYFPNYKWSDPQYGYITGLAGLCL